MRHHERLVYIPARDNGGIVIAQIYHDEIDQESTAIGDLIAARVSDEATPQNRALTASFIFGSRGLYNWIHLNTKIQMMRTEHTNNAGKIVKQALMTSVNAALQVDLLDQANASRIDGKIYSGFGGQTDFSVGSLHSRGGQPFVA